MDIQKEFANAKKALDEAVANFKKVAGKMAAGMALVGTVTNTAGIATELEARENNRNNKKMAFVTNSEENTPMFLTDPTQNRPQNKQFRLKLDPKDEKIINDGWNRYSNMFQSFVPFSPLGGNGRLKYHQGEHMCTVGYSNVYTFLPVDDNVFYVYECRDHDPKGLPDNPMNPEIKTHYKNNDTDWFLYQAKLALMLHTLPELRKRLAEHGLPAPEKLPENVLWALLFAGYEGGDFDGVLAKLKEARTIQDIVDAFSYIRSTNTPKQSLLIHLWARRYWFGLLAANKVIPEELNDFAVSGLSHLDNKDYIVKDSENGLKLTGYRWNKFTGCEFIIDDATVAANIKKVERASIKATRARMKAQAKDTKAMIANARKALKEERFLDAVNQYKQIIKIDKNNAEAYSELSLAYVNLGALADYNKQYSKMLQYYEAAVKTAKMGLALDPEDRIKAHLSYNAGLARSGLGDYYHDKDNFSRAEEEYHKAEFDHDVAFKIAPIPVYKNARDKAKFDASLMRSLNEAQKERRLNQRQRDGR